MFPIMFLYSIYVHCFYSGSIINQTDVQIICLFPVLQNISYTSQYITFLKFTITNGI